MGEGLFTFKLCPEVLETVRQKLKVAWTEAFQPLSQRPIDFSATRLNVELSGREAAVATAENAKDSPSW